MLDKQKLLRAVLTRLRLAQFTGDLAQVLTPEAVAEGVRLAGALHNAPENPVPLEKSSSLVERRCHRVESMSG